VASLYEPAWQWAMRPEQLVAFIGFALVVAGTPGPSNALLTATGATVGVLRGLPALVGVAAGMAVLMFVVGVGLGTIILQTPVILTAIKWAGAAVLLWLARKIVTSPVDGLDHGVRPIGFVGAATFQWINPKSWLACASAAATFLQVDRGSAYVQAATLALIFVLVALPSCFVWLAFGAVVQRPLRSARVRRIFNIAMGALLAASVVLLIA
jgi:threonine/homoserine/homoserine lactone efflux protein